MSESEKQEFMQQYEKIHVALMRFCIVKSHGIMDPQDLANDTLLVGLENYHNIENKQALLSYLFSTANNICLNQLRRKKFSGPYDERQANNMQDHSTAIEEKVDVTVLYAALDQLPDLQKEAVILFEISDLPIKEIMLIQDSGESAVKQRIKRGREKLAELMQEKKRRKIAVVTSLLITSNSFGMTDLNNYFNAVKEIPLPISQPEAIATIGKFKLGAAASKASGSAAIKSTLIVKKGLVGITLLSAVITTTVVLSSSREENPVQEEAFLPVSVDETPSEKEKLIAFVDQDEKETYVHDWSQPQQEEVLSLIQEGKLDLADVPDEFVLDLVDVDPLLERAKGGPDELFHAQGVKTVSIGNMGDELIVKTWDESTVKVESNHIVETKKPEDRALILERLTYDTEKKDDVYKVGVAACLIKSIKRKSKNGSGTIVFSDGKRVKFKKFETKYTVTVPKSTNLEVKGQYRKLTVPDLEKDLSMKLHNAELNVGQIGGNMDVRLMYCNGRIGDVGGEANMYLHDSDLEMGSSKDMDLDCKYSSFSGTSIGALKLNLFDGSLELEEINGDVDGSVKYSSFNCLSDMEDVELVLFDSKLSAGAIKSFKGSIKYSTLKSKGVEEFLPKHVFESELELGAVGRFEPEGSKYSDYTIKQLSSGATVTSFSDHLTIQHVLASVDVLSFSGKYSTYEIELSQDVGYQISTSTHYGSFDYKGLNIEVINNEKKNQMEKMKGMIDGGTTGSPMIDFDCFDCTINLEGIKV